VHERTSNRRRRMSIGTGSIALSLGLCLCAGQLVATPAASAAAPVVQAAAAAKVKPRLNNSVNASKITYGSRVRVTATLRDPRTGKAVKSGGTIRLQTWKNGAWRNWLAKSVPASGNVVFLATPPASVYLRTRFAGNTSFQAVPGKELKVTVQNRGTKVLAEAKKHTGALYKFAAAGPSRFDCSGFTMYVYKKAAGKSLPHKANSQQKYGSAVAKANKRIGDLIILRSGSYGYHAGVYAGGGYMYDSPHTGARVGKHKIYTSNYVVRRLV
jgi:cell wall-associated NlpC family hydrolase